MLKKPKKLFKPCVTIKIFDEDDKVIIEHDLKKINLLTSTNAEIKAFTFLQNERFHTSVEIRTKG